MIEENPTDMRQPPQPYTKRKYVANSGVRQHVNVAQRALLDAMERVEENEIAMEVVAIAFAMKYRLGKTIPDIEWLLKQMSDARYWRTNSQIRLILERIPDSIPAAIRQQSRQVVTGTVTEAATWAGEPIL